MNILRSKLLSWFALIFMCALLYWPGLNGGFFFDDFANIVDAPEIKIDEISVHTVKTAWESGNSGPLGRPVSMISFALNYYFAGFSPFWFKLTNVAIHGLNAILVCILLNQIADIFLSKQRDSLKFSLTVLLAMIWACHPIQLTSVLYVVQRMTSLSSMFVLLALILHIQGRQVWQGRKAIMAMALAWLVFFPLSILCKETGVLYFGYVFTYELLARRIKYDCYDQFGRVYLVGLAVFGFVFLLYLKFFPSWLWGGYVGRPFTLIERALTEFRVLCDYVGLMFAPTLPSFSLYHDDVGLSNDLFSPISTLYSIFGFVFVVLVAALLLKKAPLITFSVLWFIVGHSLESSILPLELMHEHRNYLPSLSLVFLFMQVFNWLAFAFLNGKFVFFWAGTGLLGYCAVLTYLRADMYGDDVRRTQLEAQYHPRSARSQYDAGALLVNLYNLQPDARIIPFALKHFEATNQIDPNFKMAFVGILQLECLSKKGSSEEVVEQLAKRLSVGVISVQERATMNGIAHALNTGTLCLSRSQVDKLFSSVLSNPLARDGDKARILNRYAMYLWLGQKDYHAALSAMKNSFSLGDQDPVNRLNAIQLMRALGDKAGVLNMLNDIEGRKLTELDRANLNELKSELLAEGVLEGVSQ